MASPEVLFLMMAIIGIKFMTKFDKKRFYATFYLFCRTLNFSRFKVEVEIFYQTTHVTFSLLGKFSQRKTTNVKSVFLIFSFTFLPPNHDIDTV